MPHARRASAGSRSRAATPRRRTRLLRRTAHLESEVAAPPACPLCGSGWWIGTRSLPLDLSPAPILFTRGSLGSPLPPQVPVRALGATERLLLNMMIVAGWRLMRLSTMEAAGVDREYENVRNSNTSDMTVPVRANMAYRNLCDNSRSLGVLNSIESRLQRQFDSAF